jgi:hypothetical protein
MLGCKEFVPSNQQSRIFEFEEVFLCQNLTFIKSYLRVRFMCIMNYDNIIGIEIAL